MAQLLLPVVIDLYLGIVCSAIWYFVGLVGVARWYSTLLG